MFDANGNWQNQNVNLGHTENGKKGFFTNGYLAHQLTDEQYAQCKASAPYAIALAQSLRFHYLP